MTKEEKKIIEDGYDHAINILQHVQGERMSLEDSNSGLGIIMAKAEIVDKDGVILSNIKNNHDLLVESAIIIDKVLGKYIHLLEIMDEEEENINTNIDE